MKNIYILILLPIVYLSLGISSLNAYVLTYDAHVRVSEEYNDNLYQDSNHEVDDFITVISPGVRSDLRWQRTGINTSYDFGYSMYQTYSENDSMRHNASLGGWWEMTHNTNLRVTDMFVQSEDIEDLGYEGGGDYLRDSTTRTNTARVDLDHRFGERRNTSLGYAYRTLENDGYDTEDNQSHEVVGALSYFFSPWFGMEAEFDYTRGLYDISQDFDEWNGTLRFIKVVSRHMEWNASYSHSIMKWDGQGTERDYQVYNPSVGLRYTIDNESQMAVNAGYFVQDLEGGENEKGSTLDGNIGKTWSFRQGSINVTASSGYEESQLGTDNLGFTVYYGAGSGFDYQIHRNASTRASLSYRNNDYINSDPDRTDETITASWSLNWQIRPWLESGLEYNWTNRDSTIDSYDYIENRIQIFLSWVFAERKSSRSP